MNKIIRIILVLGGYVLALIVTAGVAALRIAIRPDSVTQGSPGMYAFGDSMFFLGLFIFLCIPPTVLALWFLRKNIWFWNVAAILILALAVTAPMAHGLRILIQALKIDQGVWILVDVVALIRTLAIPIMAFGYGVCLLVAPTARIRWAIGIAIAIESLTGVFILLQIMFWHKLW